MRVKYGEFYPDNGGDTIPSTIAEQIEHFNDIMRLSGEIFKNSRDLTDEEVEMLNKYYDERYTKMIIDFIVGTNEEVEKLK